MEKLIRLQRWEVSERRRHAAELDGLAERLRGELLRLGEAPPTEAAVAAMERRRTLEQSLAEVELRIVEARDALAQALEQMKRYETVAANSERMRLRRIARREHAGRRNGTE